MKQNNKTTKVVFFNMHPELFPHFPCKFPKHHKGLRGEVIKCIEKFYNTHKRFPQLAQRRLKGSDNDRETVLANESLKKWTKSSQRATYSWAVGNYTLLYR